MSHKCHWPDCQKDVPPKMFMCLAHWRRVPRVLQLKIWSTYRAGQEIDKRPSAEYLAVVALVQGWIAGKVTIDKDGSVVVQEDLPLVGGRS